MRRIAVSAVRERIADVVAHVHIRRERIVLTRHGRPVGAIVPIEDLELLDATTRVDPSVPSIDSMTAYRHSWRRLTERVRRPRH